VTPWVTSLTSITSRWATFAWFDFCFEYGVLFNTENLATVRSCFLFHFLLTTTYMAFNSGGQGSPGTSPKCNSSATLAGNPLRSCHWDWLLPYSRSRSTQTQQSPTLMVKGWGSGTVRRVISLPVIPRLRGARD
jgi:hypothetical protein